MRPAQIVIFMDSAGNIHAEAPGQNGSRNKISLPFDFRVNNPELVAELQLQNEKERDRERRIRADQQNSNIQYVAETQSVRFAQQVWGKDFAELSFGRALKRLHNTDSETGERLNRTQKSKVPSDGKDAVDIDLEF